MNHYAPIPENVNFKLLIELLRDSYEHGDGGLPAHSAIDKVSISRFHKADDIYARANFATIWNIAVRRLSCEQIRRCDLDVQEPIGDMRMASN